MNFSRFSLAATGLRSLKSSGGLKRTVKFSTIYILKEIS
jgi:hypothetical protein